MPDECGPCVLLVDDDDLVREALGSSLRRSGFTVLPAAGGTEAVDLYRLHGTRVVVVLLDVKMPLMDGPQTLAALRELDSGVRCCFMSGYAEDYSRDQLLALGASHFFIKPFSMMEITVALRQLLGSTTPNSQNDLL